MAVRVYKLVNALIFVFLFSLVIGCKKEDKVDTCTDGFLTPGETQIDCGGPCQPCQEQFFSSSRAVFENEFITFPNFSIDAIGNYVFSTSNDSLSLQLNFGNGDTLGGRPITPGTYSNASLNGVSYPTLTEGTVVITELNLEDSLMSGYYQAKLFRAVFDTLIFTGGEFSNIPF